MTKTRKAALFDWIVSNPRFRLEEWHRVSTGAFWIVYLDSHSDDPVGSGATPEDAISNAWKNSIVD